MCENDVKTGDFTIQIDLNLKDEHAYEYEIKLLFYNKKAVFIPYLLASVSVSKIGSLCIQIDLAFSFTRPLFIYSNNNIIPRNVVCCYRYRH